MRLRLEWIEVEDHAPRTGQLSLFTFTSRRDQWSYYYTYTYS